MLSHNYNLTLYQLLDFLLAKVTELPRVNDTLHGSDAYNLENTRFELVASRMQSGRSTTELIPHIYIFAEGAER